MVSPLRPALQTIADVDSIADVGTGSCSSLLDYACICRDNAYQMDIAVSAP